MVNRSQIQDPRFYAKWKAAGALGDIHEPERREAKRHYKNMLIYNGGLSKAEVKEAVSYKFGDGAVTLTEQTRKYYLMVKENHPKEAGEMLADAQKLLDKGIDSISEVEALLRAIRKRVSGYVLCFNGEVYSINKGRFGTTSELYNEFSRVSPQTESIQ